MKDYPAAMKEPAFWSALSLIAVGDVITKYLAHTLLQPTHLPREVLGNAVRFTLVYNPGAAFGLNVGQYSRWIFIVLTVGAVIILFRLLRETPPTDRIRLAAIGLVLGGAIGNLVNRLWSSRGVVDFLDVGVGDLRWPTFNLADIGVSVGAFLLAWALWGSEHEESLVRGKENSP